VYSLCFHTAEAEEGEEGTVTQRKAGPERFSRRLGGPVILLTTKVRLGYETTQRAEDKALLWGPTGQDLLRCSPEGKEREK
jgi:hypothetical protein